MIGEKMRWMLRTERLLVIVAVLLLALYVSARIHRSVLSRATIRAFEKQQKPDVGESAKLGDLAAAEPDFRLWSPQRIKDYQDSIAAYASPAIAILRIPKVDIEVPVLEGTDDLALNRGVGHIEGTARPGESGNMGIAGHRDGFFRGLKDVVNGDKIELITKKGTENYIIDQITIVKRADVSVLAPRERSSLTLVTCYPFYFIGSAPERYIVQASLADTDRERSSPLQQETDGRSAVAQGR
jgi:sortase A